MNKILQIIKDWFTARNGVDYSFTKIIIGCAGTAMIYKFVVSEGVDYVGFAAGITALGGTLTAKYHFEEPAK